MRQHPGSNNCVEGAYGIARFDGARGLWRAMGMRDRPAGCASCASRLCGVLCGSGRPPRGGRRRSFVGGNRAMLAAPRIGAARRRRRAPATTGHRAAACDQHDTRRHTATSARQRARPTRHSPPRGDIDADVFLLRAGRARGSSGCSPAVLKDQQKRARVNPLAPNPRARAREGAALAARARGWCATAPRFKQLR